VGTVEFGSGTTTVHAQLVASALGTTVDRAHSLNGHNGRGGVCDTGASGSAGVVVAGQALLAAADQLRELMLERVLARWRRFLG
jgi:CO/xanthine dehydrogenase Mo-binding subunit